MSAIVKSLEKSIESNNLEKIATTMNQFEKQFENLDLQTQVGVLGGGGGRHETTEAPP
jgi:charged multivesicular body protein 1